MAVCSALLHFEGANNSTTFTDESGKTWTTYGTPIISTADHAVGSSSGQFTSYGDFIKTVAHADFQFGTGDFTIQCWVSHTADSEIRRIIGNSYSNTASDPGGWLLYTTNNGQIWFVAADSTVGGSVSLYSPDPVFTSGGFAFVSVSRTSGVFRLRVSGTLIDTQTPSPAFNVGQNKAIYVSADIDHEEGYILGYIDELRILKGVAVETTLEQAQAGFTLTSDMPSPPPEGIATLPITVSVAYGVGSVELPVGVSVVPPSIISGDSTVSDSGSLAAVWVPIVKVDSVDVSDKIIGVISVEAEEGAARVADFVIRPNTGETISLPQWVGKSVTIDIADYSTGVALSAMRLFTGVIDSPSFDIVSATIGCKCTDDYQGKIDGMTSAFLLSLIGGRYSPVVFDAAAKSLSYANDLLSTVPGSLDFNAYGAVRLTAWAPKTTADFVFDEDSIGDGSLSVSLSDRSSLVNQVDIAFGYRFPRVKREAHGFTYAYVTESGFSAYVAAGNWLLQRESVLSAISGASATVETITWQALPSTPVGSWVPGPYDDLLCMGFTATVTFDYVQDNEEAHALRVYCQGSIDEVGARRKTMSGALVGEYPSTETTETSILLYKADISAIPPQDYAPTLSGKTNAAEVALTTETDRAAADSAMEVLIDIAKRDIYASHRGNIVSASVPLNPVIDLDKTITVDAAGVLAKGKCVRASYRMDVDSGAAVTDFAVAICSISGVGYSHPEDATAAPAGTSAGNTTLATSPAITFNYLPAGDKSFSISFPGVEEAERNKAIIALPVDIQAAIIEDTFTVTV